MKRRGRLRAPLSGLIAACLGVLVAVPTSAFAAAPVVKTGHSAVSPGDRAKVKSLLEAKRKQSNQSAKTTSPTLPDGVKAACDVPKSENEARCFALRVTGVNGGKGVRAAAPEGLAPSDLLSAYNLPTDGGAGTTIAVVDAYDNPKAAADLAVYRQQFGLPPLTDGQFIKVNQDGIQGHYPRFQDGWAAETILDLDMVSAVAPKAKIILVEANSDRVDDLGESVNEAVALGATEVSNSYGSNYFITPGSGESANDLALSQKYYDHPGVAIVASSGDTYYGVSFPASSPTVTAVGGTSLKADPSTARGWRESVWDGAGSGCSTIEVKPSFQKDTGCDKRTVTDVSAVADPGTAVAVYDSVHGGWTGYGGTSVSAPIIAATYALAGPMTAGTYPNSYPYANSRLNDVTSGFNGTCDPTYLCSGTVGYDGPSGLGTPNGTTAFHLGAIGTVSGTVTDGADAPMAGVHVALTDDSTQVYTAATDSKGAYRLGVSPGTYHVSASSFGYESATDNVTVTADTTATADLKLVKVPTRRLSGKVTDGSGNGWPLYAKITIDGVPSGTLYTNPRTGIYSTNLPSGATYTMHVAPVYPGYTKRSIDVALGADDVRRNVSVAADMTACTAPGYSYIAQADFEDWGKEPRYGWSTTHTADTKVGWEFDEQPGENVFTGNGSFASADPLARGLFDGSIRAEDTDLTSPSFDLSGQTSAALRFDAFEFAGALDASISTDDGSTWTKVFQTDDIVFLAPVDVPLTQALGHSNVKVRFHYVGHGESWGQVDNVSVGQCRPIGGGMITGTVTDGNTHRPLNGATVTVDAAPLADRYRSSASAPGTGFYWLYSPNAGANKVTTTAPRYTTTTANVVVSRKVSRYTPELQAGQLKVTSGKVTLDAALDGKASQDVTLTNTGQAPIKVTVAEQSQAPSSPALETPADQSWQVLPNYPTNALNDGVIASYEGKIYGVGGSTATSIVSDGYVYERGADSWSRITPLPEPRTNAAGAFLNGTLYVVGGGHFVEHVNVASPSTFAYHPHSNSWSRVADLPQAMYGSAVAVLDGKLYVIGGFDSRNRPVATSYRYDPARDTWSQIADYPVITRFNGCGGVNDSIVCAGGMFPEPDPRRDQLITGNTYVYHPTTNTWTQGADMPHPEAQSWYSAANGKLQVYGGWNQDMYPFGYVEGESNRAQQYDPIADVWTDLPNTPYGALGAARRGTGTGCGVSMVGGEAGYAHNPQFYNLAARLPGFDQCGGDDVNWLSESATTVTLAPGHSTQVRVTADARVLTAPGGYAASLSLIDDSPYGSHAVPVALKATAPANWAEITGTVSDGGGRLRLGGAGVTLSRAGTDLITATTNSQGVYDMWLKASSGKTTVTVTNDGYDSSSQQVDTTPGGRTKADFALQSSR